LPDAGPVAGHGNAGESDPAPARDIHAVQPQREIREALAAGRLELHYQPIVRLDTFEITSVEALLRWNHPDGELGPDDFLPSVAQTPVIRDITRHVLKVACEEALLWPAWTMSVNVAAADVIHPEFAADVQRALDSAGLDPHRLTLELTEQSVVQDVERATEHLQRLRDQGVGIALDDFGTGYSSLLYLRTLPVTQLKIDRLFIDALGNDDDDAIINSVVRLANTIKVDVVAEGVETPEQVRFLQSVGCGSGQGNLFGRPRPASELSLTTASEWIGPSPPPAPTADRPSSSPVDPDTLATVQLLLADGASLHTVAAALNRVGSTTSQGARWTARTVAHVVAELPDPPGAST
jgi:EAL domain-containing protein (putative c-di-GMP-specific phosphodiesterase class I)